MGRMQQHSMAKGLHGANRTQGWSPRPVGDLDRLRGREARFGSCSITDERAKLGLREGVLLGKGGMGLE